MHPFPVELARHQPPTTSEANSKSRGVDIPALDRFGIRWLSRGVVSATTRRSRTPWRSAPGQWQGHRGGSGAPGWRHARAGMRCCSSSTWITTTSGWWWSVLRHSQAGPDVTPPWCTPLHLRPPAALPSARCTTPRRPGYSWWSRSQRRGAAFEARRRAPPGPSRRRAPPRPPRRQAPPRGAQVEHAHDAGGEPGVAEGATAWLVAHDACRLGAAHHLLRSLRRAQAVVRHHPRGERQTRAALPAAAVNHRRRSKCWRSTRIAPDASGAAV